MKHEAAANPRAPSARVGVLLVNLGTPDSPSVGDVRRYLGEFLMDPRVIDVPWPLRWLLVHGLILRTRPAKSAEAYRLIWTERGSPLLFHGLDLAQGLGAALGEEVAEVRLAMRYQSPSIRSELERFATRDIDDVLVVPLYPQYSQSAWAATFDEVVRQAGRLRNVPSLRFLPPFYAQPAFLDAVAEVARPQLADFGAERVLMSFHGLPVKHIRKSDNRGGGHCLASADCCASIGPVNRHCYRAQSFATARGLAERLGLGPEEYEVAFQSRLTSRWIEPFTDARLEALPAEGVRRVAVLCPSFVADCLETIEEIGIRAQATFRGAGGEALCAIPCVNAHPSWIRGLAGLLREHLPGSALPSGV